MTYEERENLKFSFYSLLEDAEYLSYQLAKTEDKSEESNRIVKQLRDKHKIIGSMFVSMLPH